MQPALGRGGKPLGKRLGASHMACTGEWHVLNPSQESYSIRTDLLCPSYQTTHPTACVWPDPAGLIYAECAERMLSPACHLPGSQRKPCWSRAGEKPAEPASDCSRLLLQRGKERRRAGASNSRLPTCTSPAGLGTAPGASIFPACIPWDVRGPRCSLLPREHLPAAARIQPGMESLSSSLKKKATEQHYRAEVMIAGEQLRLRLHDGKLIKDRRYHLRTYPNCFVAKELTDWLIDHKEAPDRETGIRLMQKLMDHYIIHHVCDEHSDYKDAKLLYRFRKDDGTFPLISNRHHFFDSDILYQFWINFRRRRRLTELLNENSSRTLSESPDSPFCLRKLNPDPGNTSFLSVQTNKEIKIVSAVRRSSITSLAGNSNPYFSATPMLVFPPVAECNPKSVLKRPVTNEELLSPGAPYIKKTLTIVGDAVGWGFVVRGGRPCHIQAVDPGGPAAAAGMKVCQFVFSVNGMYVLHLDYQTISSLIMTGPRTLVMEVMEAIE
ncbi:DEP domain-containing mTOR-interacting protein-like isoform X3 [Chroicocephalus ridibundus]|uniref:DEP domain-containing mTOR-interacting protein-like isoform X3 n=1 Tax=Chroicocephalus ridibundus TaxID=1192867 RepID=UPI002FDDC0FC